MLQKNNNFNLISVFEGAQNKVTNNIPPVAYEIES